MLGQLPGAVRMKASRQGHLSSTTALATFFRLPQSLLAALHPKVVLRRIHDALLVLLVRELPAWSPLSPHLLPFLMRRFC